MCVCFLNKNLNLCKYNVWKAACTALLWVSWKLVFIAFERLLENVLIKEQKEVITDCQLSISIISPIALWTQHQGFEGVQEFVFKRIVFIWLFLLKALANQKNKKETSQPIAVIGGGSIPGLTEDQSWVSVCCVSLYCHLNEIQLNKPYSYSVWVSSVQ